MVIFFDVLRMLSEINTKLADKMNIYKGQLDKDICQKDVTLDRKTVYNVGIL